MAFINIPDHEKFRRLFHSLVADKEKDTREVADENAELLKSDMARLQSIIEQYKDTVSKLHELTSQYKIIQHRAKVNMRKRQIKLNRQQSRLFGSRQ